MLQTVDALDLGDEEQRRLVTKSKIGHGVGHIALNLAHVVGALHKGGGNEVHVLGHTISNVRAILFN